MKILRLLTFLFFSSLIVTSSLVSQDQLTVEDYAKAEKMLRSYTSDKVIKPFVRPNWQMNGRFWYNLNTPEGNQIVDYNPVTKRKRTMIDSTGSFKGMNGGRARGSNLEIMSPDEKKVAFIRDWNLWIKDLGTNEEIQLTVDGEENYGYATDNAGWRKSDRPILLWSPDSKKIATFKQDQRHVSDMYLVKTTVGAPELQSWKYPLPQDDKIIQIERVIIDVENKEVLRLNMSADPRRGTLCDDISCSGGFDDNVWSEDSQKLVFVSSSRDHKVATVRIADAKNGVVNTIMEESVETQFESGRGTINWTYLSATDELIWYSERDDWGHLYLYDANSGDLKNQITKGDWVVTQVLRIDEKNRVIYFNAQGKEEGRDPYFNHFYKIKFDGTGLKLLTPEDANHRISLSKEGYYFVDNYSTPTQPNIAVIRKNEGTLVEVLEEADISALLEAEWKAPEPFSVKSADGQWDLYGLMYTPSNLDPKKKYPVVNYIYPGPQGGSVGSKSFSTSKGGHQALAELGFVVIALEGSCNPGRSKSFHDACYGNMGENTLPDQIAGVKELAKKHSFIDLNRVGVWGHSGGGYATAAALLKYPDFYKVGVSQSGNHDNRNYEDDWGERYIGLLQASEDVSDNYEAQANQVYAENLKGKLLLAHGGMDDNVPPYNTYLLVDALIKANKDFDLIIYPNARHGYGSDNQYMTRRRWDYFVTHLMGATPPKEYKMGELK
ncbi:MAG: prolyl oligopeptidase family serine peptidase [Saprospiraceae bacterium]|nr:prolyl oligopeptidase family serine peptidase [Saprospiraceae bacterium]